MKLKDMVPGVRYVVIKGGCTLEKGDKVWIDADKNLMSSTGGGWLPSEEWKRLRNEVKFDAEHYKKEIEKLQARIKICEDFIEQHRGEE